MLKQGRRTSVVWSFESSSLDEALLPTIADQNVDAIRIALSPEKWAKSRIIAGLNKGKHEDDEFPVLVDLYSHPRAMAHVSWSLS